MKCFSQNFQQLLGRSVRLDLGHVLGQCRRRQVLLRNLAAVEVLEVGTVMLVLVPERLLGHREQVSHVWRLGDVILIRQLFVGQSVVQQKLVGWQVVGAVVRVRLSDVVDVQVAD